MTLFNNAGETDAKCIHIGLVNNMPDSALEATERQFRALLSEAADGIAINLSLFALPEIPRSDKSKKRIENSYSNVSALWNNRLDGLIVTGAEPVSPSLADEPYWGTLTRLIEWAENNTHSSVWSCLAAHAAVLRMDGIERRRLADKLCGVFECTNVSGQALTAGIPLQFRMPHSRWNDIPAEALSAYGYRVLTQLRDGSPDTFVKQRKSLFVFFQGHPEYDSSSLLFEYRRDIRRFLNGERDTYPSMPQGYLDEDSAAAFADLRTQAVAEPRKPFFKEFPEASVRGTWHPQAVGLYRNWLRHLSEGKSSRLQHRQRQMELKCEHAAVS